MRGVPPLRLTAKILALLALLCPLAWSCAPSACSDAGERRMTGWVEVVTGEPGTAADQAEEALVAAGHPAILYLETGLYDAEPRARRRIVRILTRIGDPAARPILAHLARRDPDPTVREAAQAGARTLEGARSP